MRNPTNPDAKASELTKREYFAGQALQGMCAALKPTSIDTVLDIPHNVAQWSVLFADELIKKLNLEEK